jgi:hypothetical protein
MRSSEQRVRADAEKLLMKNFQDVEKRYRYKVLEGKWKLSMTPDIEMELDVRFKDSTITPNKKESFVLTGTLTRDHKTTEIAGSVMENYVSFYVAADGTLLNYVVMCEGLVQENTTVIDRMRGFVYNVDGITGGVYGSHVE